MAKPIQTKVRMPDNYRRVLRQLLDRVDDLEDDVARLKGRGKRRERVTLDDDDDEEPVTPRRGAKSKPAEDDEDEGDDEDEDDDEERGGIVIVP